MRLDTKQLKIVQWTARIISLSVLLFGLPFYFGYGNPLPFINPAYTLWDNVWLCVFPLMFGVWPWAGALKRWAVTLSLCRYAPAWRWAW